MFIYVVLCANFAYKRECPRQSCSVELLPPASLEAHPLIAVACNYTVLTPRNHATDTLLCPLRRRSRLLAALGREDGGAGPTAPQQPAWGAEEERIPRRRSPASSAERKAGRMGGGREMGGKFRAGNGKSE